MRTRFAALIFLLPALATAAPFPPGLERDVLALTSGDLPGGCVASGIGIQSFAIDLKVRCGDDLGTLRLFDRDEPDRTGEIRQTSSFSLRAQPSTPAVEAAERTLADRIAQRDDGMVHRKLGGSAPQVALKLPDHPSDQWTSARRLGAWDDARRALSWIALVALLAWLIAARAKRIGARRFAFLLVAFAFALALRIQFGAWAPLHANSHGIAELRGLASTPADWQGPVETDRYGVAYRQIVRSVIGLWHGRAESALAFAAVAGALSVVPLAILTFLITDSVAAAAIAAFGLAVHPIHITLSPSESPMPLAGLLFLIGAACWCAVARFDRSRLRGAAYWAGALALGCSAELAVTTIAFAVAGVIVAIGLWRFADWKLWLPPMLVMIATVALHAYALNPVMSTVMDERAGGLAQALRTFTGTRDALFDPTLVSRVLLPLAAIGMIALLVRRQWEGIAFAVASVVLIAASAVVNACRTDAIRYQGTAHLLLFVLAGAAVTWMAASRGIRPIGYALAAVVLVPSSSVVNAARSPSADVDAYRLIAVEAGSVPPTIDVHIAPRRMAGGLVLNDFPEFLPQAAGKIVTVEESPPPEGAHDRCTIWLGPPCFSFTPDEKAAAIRPECAQFQSGTNQYPDYLWPTFRTQEFHQVPAVVPVELSPCGPKAY